MTRERFFGQVILASAPLMLWAAHFAALYLVVAAQCSPALAPGMPSVGLLWSLTAIAAAACLALLWQARAALAPDAGLVRLAQAGSALLALAGIAWNAVPLLLLDGCG